MTCILNFLNLYAQQASLWGAHVSEKSRSTGNQLKPSAGLFLLIKSRETISLSRKYYEVIVKGLLPLIKSSKILLGFTCCVPVVLGSHLMDHCENTGGVLRTYTIIRLTYRVVRSIVQCFRNVCCRLDYV
jgi:hypothetical protein